MVEKVINVKHNTTSQFGLSRCAMCCIWGCGKSSRGQVWSQTLKSGWGGVRNWGNPWMHLASRQGMAHDQESRTTAGAGAWSTDKMKSGTTDKELLVAFPYVMDWWGSPSVWIITCFQLAKLIRFYVVMEPGCKQLQVEKYQLAGCRSGHGSYTCSPLFWNGWNILGQLLCTTQRCLLANQAEMRYSY